MNLKAVNVANFKPTKAELRFIKFIKKECRAAKIKVRIPNTTYVKADNLACSGYFSEDDKVIKVARKCPALITTLAHEYCHMRQWLEKEPLYIKAQYVLQMDDWLNGKDIKNIEKYVAIVRDMELDCEMRTVRLLAGWYVVKNMDLHIKRANAYIQFHNYLLKTRLWYVPGNTPYNNQTILRTMSAKFDMDYENLAPEIEKAFDKARIGYAL